MCRKLSLHPIFLILALVLCGHTIYSQKLQEGNYSSSDLGYTYTVSVKHEGNAIELTEPNKINRYLSNGGNKYFHTEPQYSHYYIRVAGTDKYYAGREGTKEQLFSLGDGDAAMESGIDNCPKYDKYLSLSRSGADDEVQAWAFCGAAALAKCTYTDAEKNFIAPIIKSLKMILEDPSKCPCEDVISQSEWNSVQQD